MNEEWFPLVNEEGETIGKATRRECHNGSKKLHPVMHLHLFNTALPDCFVSASDIHYKDRIKVQSVPQRYIDASISSTINLPNSTTIEQVADIYMEAWIERCYHLERWVLA